jgi:hypothetical protein
MAFELVERFVHAEDPAVAAELLSRMRQHHIARRIADRLADPLENDQHRRGGPAPGERQGRHGCHLDDVTENRDRPIFAGRIRPSAREEAEAITKELSQAGDDRHNRRGRAQRAEIGSDDAP